MLGRGSQMLKILGSIKKHFFSFWCHPGVNIDIWRENERKQELFDRGNASPEWVFECRVVNASFSEINLQHQPLNFQRWEKYLPTILHFYTLLYSRPRVPIGPPSSPTLLICSNRILITASYPAIQREERREEKRRGERKADWE